VYAINLKREFKQDHLAVMDIPHKLMISTIILTLVLPIVLNSVEITNDNIAEQELENQCEFLANNIIMVYSQGSGAVQNLVLKLPETTDFVRAGASLQNDFRPDRITIRFKIIDEIAQRTVVGNGLVQIAMCSDNNDTFSITTGGVHTVRLEKMGIDLDLNGDGLKPDHYIMISFI
jgi:hypothetical protein